MPNPAARCVLICQNRTCRRAGSDKVLAAFHANPIPLIEIQASGCLGRCGNGPMVLVLPEEVWYSRIRPAEVERIRHLHLILGQPVLEYLDPLQSRG